MCASAVHSAAAASTARRNSERTASRAQDTLPDRLRAFFSANPDEELTMADVIVKFDATPSNASMAVRRVCLTGEVEFTTRVIRASQPHPREGSA